MMVTRLTPGLDLLALIADTTPMPRFPGSKWLNEASYITPEQRQRVLATVARAREVFPEDKVSVRPATYIGEPAALATVCHGGFIFEMVYP